MGRAADALAIASGLAFGVLIIAALAATARRLLGLRVSLARTALAGGVGYVVAALVSTTIDRPIEAWSLITVLVGISVLVAMAVLVLAEAALPSGAGGRPIRGLRLRAARSQRYWQIVRIAFRHGLGPYLRGGRVTGGRASMARSLREALEEAGVTFVKLGQMLSTRRDLLAPELIAELDRLQAEATPAPEAEVAALLREELGAPPEDVFAAFDPVPLAAGSIAQAHRATLRDGADVVVKVQRPGIETGVERDLDIVRRLAETMHSRRARGTSALGTIERHGGDGLDLTALAEGFADALREELDFRIEARNLHAVATGDIRVPAVHERLSSRRVLVLERLDGLPLGAAQPLLEGADRTALARDLLDQVLLQIVDGGVFHADPHPGNVIVLRDGGLALLDFGSVGRLDPRSRTALQDLLIAVERRDPPALRDALLELTGRPDELDERALERALGRFVAQHLGPGAAGLEMFTSLLELVAEFDLSVPGDVAGVFRALAALEGTLRLVAPGFDLVEESRRFALTRLRERTRPAAIRDTLTDELTALLPVLRRLPQHVDRVASALEDGRLGIGVRLFADERDRRVVTTLVHQVVLAFVGAALGLMGVLLLGTPGGPEVGGETSLFDVAGYNLLLVSFVLVLRILLVAFRPER